MHASKEKTTSLEMMLSRCYSSKEEFLKDYKKLCCENSKAKEFYLLALIELAKTISEDDIESLKKLSTLIGYTSDLESKVTLEECYDNTDNPIRSTNLVILASKHNGIKILRYLLDSDGELLNNLSVGIGKESTSPKDEDEVHHNAFYYAIRSEDIHLLDTLITNKYFNNYFAVHSEELEEILSKTYEELQLKNLPLSDEMQYFVEHKLIDRRFFSTGQHPSSNITDVHILTKNRIELLLHSISVLKRDYLKTNKVDGKFLYMTKFIAQNIHILKGRLRSTYDRIPWEETEFCLVIFVSSQTSVEEVNLFYRTILNKKKILNYLENVANHLRDDEDVTKGDKRKTREDNVKNIISAYPQFKELYDDYDQIRDIYSLKRINDHVKLALLADSENKHGQLVIIRVLQIIGEHLKTTLESPKLSHTTSEILVLSLSQTARKIIIDLRDAISHADSLSQIMEIEKSAEVNFFINIQDDIKKVGDVITDILYKSRIHTIRILLKKVVESKTSDEIKEALVELSTAKLDLSISENFKTLERRKLEKLIKELSDIIPSKTNYEKEVFNKINNILYFSENQIKNIESNYLTGYKHLQSFNVELNSNNYADKNLAKIIKDYDKKVSKSIAAETNSKGFKEITILALNIFQSVEFRTQNDKLPEVKRLVMSIMSIIEFETGNIKWIEELREKLPKRKKTKTKEIIPVNTYNNDLELKLCDLKVIINNNSLTELKNDKKLQIIVKMLVLDIMVILGFSVDCLVNNQLFLDDNTPLLHGKCLRNYLAHDNALVDVLFSDPLIALILNAEKLTNEENIMNSNRKIGKLVTDDPAKLQQKFDRDLHNIANQERMFIALEEGDLDGVKDCMEKGADIKARSTINSWTALHFAAKSYSLKVVRFILSQNLSVNAQDNSGQTPLHVAATHGREDTVDLFLKETDVCVDVINNKGNTPLYVAAQNGHKNVVEVLLKNRADIFTPDTVKILLYCAIRNNCTDVVKILLRKELNFDIAETMDGLTVLHVAALQGHLEMFYVLLENGADINATTDRNEVPLHLATYSGHFRIVNALILQDANVNARAINGWMPLHYAVREGNVEIINSLLSYGAYVNTATITPLHIAAEFGYLEIVIVLLKHGADIHSKRRDNKLTALHYAAGKGHTEVVDCLIQNGAHINSTESNNLTALNIAVLMDHKDVAHLLITKNAKVNAKSIESITAMRSAASNGNIEMIDLLIKHGIDVGARFDNGLTPLHFAVKENQEAAVDFLIKKKADVNARDDIDCTPLHLAVVYPHAKIVKLLIDNKAQVNVEDCMIQPIHMAAQAGHKEIVEILVAEGASIDNENYFLTPLHTAITNNHKKIVEVLIEKGATVNAEDIETWSWPVFAGYPDIVNILVKNKAYVNYKDSDELTPLHYAALRGHKKIVKALIKNKADVHARSNNSGTPLLFAALHGFKDIVEILIASGSDVNLNYNTDKTPLHAAAAGGHSEIVKVLLDNKADIDINDNTNQAPIRLAAVRGHFQVVKILLQHMKVNIDAKSEDGSTLLHIASEGTNLELVKYLVDEGSDINARTSLGYKAIHVAARKGFKEGVEFFIRKGLSVTELGARDGTSLHFASLGGHLEIVSYLIEEHADVNAKDNMGFTPMHYSAIGGYKDVIEVLLKNGANYNALDLFFRRPLDLAKNKDVIEILKFTDKLFPFVKSPSEVQNYIDAGAFVNAKNVLGATPLHFAAWKGYDAVARVLLQNKANPNLIDNKGLTPLHHAAKLSHFKVVKVLLSYYAVYNAISHDGKTPSNLTEDKSIIALFKSVSDSFKYIEIDNCQVIDDLNKIRDIDTIKAIMCACNKENKTLVLAAMHSNFSKIQQLKEIHQGDISAQINKAIELCELHHYREALSTFKHALHKRIEILGLDNPGTLDIQKHVADVLRKQGNYQEALDVFEDILRKEKEMFGYDSKDTLKTTSLIAYVMYKQEKYDKAFNIYQEVYQIKKQMLGPNDEDTLLTQGHMALVLNRQGKHEEALNIFTSVYKNTEPEDHLKALRVQSNIAMVRASQNNIEKALNICKEIFQKIKVVLDINHSGTLSTLSYIGAVLCQKKIYNKALAVLKEVLNMQEKVLKPNHPDILTTRFNIGTVFFAQQKHIGALKAYREVFDHLKAVFGSNHPIVSDILKNTHKINVTLEVQGSEPSEILQHLKENIKMAAGRGDVQTIQRLLEDGADADDADLDGRTALFHAISYGHITVVNMLLKHGADVAQVTNKGNTPLHIASSEGYREIPEILLPHVSLDKMSYFINANTTSGVGAKNGFLDIVISLLEQGAMYNIKNNEGKTPLDLCKNLNISNMLKLVDELFRDAEDGNVEIIEKLQMIKPDECYVAVTNARNNQNYTLLEIITANEHKNVASKLLEMLKY